MYFLFQLGWIASWNDNYPYLKLDLDGLWNITQFAVQGASNGWFTRELRVFYRYSATCFFSFCHRGLLSLIQEGQLSVTGESMCTKYWLTAYEV